MSSNPSARDDDINYNFFPEHLKSTSYNNLKAGLKSTIDAENVKFFQARLTVSQSLKIAYCSPEQALKPI